MIHAANLYNSIMRNFVNVIEDSSIGSRYGLFKLCPEIDCSRNHQVFMYEDFTNSLVTIWISYFALHRNKTESTKEKKRGRTGEEKLTNTGK